MSTNGAIFDKDYATDFIYRYGDVVEHWKEHGDPIKRGFAIVLTKAANSKGVKS